MRPSTEHLTRYTAELLDIFRHAPEKHRAHQQSRQVLLDMAADPRCLRAAIAKELRRPGALNQRHYPSVSFPIDSNPHFTLVANCFLPLPSGELDVTANSIHHHGHLLLTTATTFGPGYEHWRFTNPRPIDRDRDIFSMALIDREVHVSNHVAFVDSFMPHAVMYPPSLTVTLALWSSRYKVAWWDRLKRFPAVEAHRERLLKIVKRLRVTDRLHLNVDGYFDFYPVPEGFKGMRSRVQFQRGPNEDYLHTIFHILQQTSNEDLAPDGALSVRGPIDNASLLDRLVRDLRRGTPIAHRFSEGLHRLDHMNFKIPAIQTSLVHVEHAAHPSPAPV